MSSSGFSLSDAVSGGLPGVAKYVAGPMQTQNAALQKKETEAGDTLKAGLTEDQDKRDALVKQATDPGGALVPPKMEPPPKATETTPLQIWGSSAMWIAAIGGLLTRRPLINSLNASAAVLNAYKQHDKEATDAAFNTWKVENENAIKMSQFAIDSLKSQLETLGADEKTKVTYFNITEKTLNGEAAFQAKSTDEAFKIVDAWQKHHDEMVKAGMQIAEKKPEMDAKLNALAAVKNLQAARQSGDANKIAAASQAVKDASEQLQVFKSGAGAGGEWTDDAINLAGTEYRLTGKMPALGMGNPAARAEIINKAAAQAKQMGQSPEEVVALQAGVGSDTAALRNISRIATASAAFENTAMKNFENALRLAKSGGIPTDNGPWVNKFIQSGETGMGDPNVPPYIASLLTGANEYAKVISGSTGSQGSTVDSRREAAEMFSGAYNYDQIKNVIYKVAKPDMDNKKNSYRDMQDDLLHAISTGRVERMAVSGAETPPPGAIEHLRKNPGLAAQFNEKYGAGSAERYLGGQ